MPAREKEPVRDIVRATSSGLVVLASPLVLRGLREHSQTPRWSVRQAFSSPRESITISAGGFAASRAEGEDSAERVEIADLERSGRVEAIAIPKRNSRGNANVASPMKAPSRAAFGFAWAPSHMRFIAAKSNGEFLYFSARGKDGRVTFAAGTVFGSGGPATQEDAAPNPQQLAWSPSGEYFAVATGEGERAKLSLWMTRASGKKASAAPKFELIGEWKAIAGLGDSSDDGEPKELRALGAIAFHPGAKLITTPLKFNGEWCDDALAFVRVPQLRLDSMLETPGEVTDLSWTSDGKRLIFCASGQVYASNSERQEIAELPFAAELCRCHPSLPLCAVYNSWLKHSARGRICIADLRRNEILDECSAEGILDLQWSRDGMILYAVAKDGTAYIWERPLA